MNNYKNYRNNNNIYVNIPHEYYGYDVTVSDLQINNSGTDVYFSPTTYFGNSLYFQGNVDITLTSSNYNLIRNYVIIKTNQCVLVGVDLLNSSSTYDIIITYTVDGESFTHIVTYPYAFFDLGQRIDNRLKYIHDGIHAYPDVIFNNLSQLVK